MYSISKSSQMLQKTSQHAFKLICGDLVLCQILTESDNKKFSQSFPRTMTSSYNRQNLRQIENTVRRSN